MPDTVSLHDLTLTAHIGSDWWDRPRPQPVVLTLHASTNVERAAAGDDVTQTIHYGHLAAAVLALQAPARVFADLMELAEAAADAALTPQFTRLSAVRVIAEAPKLLLPARGFGVDITRPKSGTDAIDKIYIKDLTLLVIIGINPPERLHRQLVITNLTFHTPPRQFPHATVVERLSQHIQSTSFLTLEAFVTSVAQIACSLDGMDVVTVNAQKPSAVSFGHSSGVQVTRNRAYFV